MSKFHGQHKYGAIHFLDRKRERFTQACRFCADIRTGRYVLMPSGKTYVVWDHVGLENEPSNSATPKVQDIDQNTGEL